MDEAADGEIKRAGGLLGSTRGSRGEARREQRPYYTWSDMARCNAGALLMLDAKAMARRGRAGGGTTKTRASRGSGMNVTVPQSNTAGSCVHAMHGICLGPCGAPPLLRVADPSRKLGRDALRSKLETRPGKWGGSVCACVCVRRRRRHGRLRRRPPLAHAGATMTLRGGTASHWPSTRRARASPARRGGRRRPWRARRGEGCSCGPASRSLCYRDRPSMPSPLSGDRSSAWRNRPRSPSASSPSQWPWTRLK